MVQGDYESSKQSRVGQCWDLMVAGKLNMADWIHLFISPLSKKLIKDIMNLQGLKEEYTAEKEMSRILESEKWVECGTRLAGPDKAMLKSLEGGGGSQQELNPFPLLNSLI